MQREVTTERERMKDRQNGREGERQSAMQEDTERTKGRERESKDRQTIREIDEEPRRFK